MSRTKRVHGIHITQRCVTLAQLLIVRFFTCVIPHVFQQHHFPFTHFWCFLEIIGNKTYRLFQQLAEPLSHWRQR